MGKRWTIEEDAWLTENYSKNGIEYCSNYLKRSNHSISQRTKRLNLCRKYNYHKFTKELLEQEYLINRKSIIKIADEYNVSHHDIYIALMKHNIVIDKHGMYQNKYHHNWNGFGEISQTYWGIVQKSAHDRNIKFDVDIKYAWLLFLQQNRKCSLSGVDLQFSTKATKYYEQQTASLDRIDSSIGYINKNIQWVHKQINFMKHTLNNEDFINWCCLVVNNKGKN